MNIRVTAILLEKGKILLLNQDFENVRNWSLPGGTVEEGETLEQALTREMKEETGLDITISRFLYICDHITDPKHVVHISFLVTKTGGKLGDITQGVDTNIIHKVEFVPVIDLEKKDLVENSKSWCKRISQALVNIWARKVQSGCKYGSTLSLDNSKSHVLRTSSMHMSEVSRI